MNNLYRNEIDQLEIKKLILNAWKDSNSLIERSQDEYNNVELKPEYLITVKIADRIVNEIIENNLSTFALKLEEQTKYVFERCFQDIRRDKNNNLKLIRRGKRNSILRNGKFDITVYKKDTHSSIDSYRTYFVIDRIYELISSTDSNSANSMKYGILTFSKKLNKKEMIESLFSNKMSLVKKRKKYHIIKKLGIVDRNIITTVFEISQKFDGDELENCFVRYALAGTSGAGW